MTPAQKRNIIGSSVGILAAVLLFFSAGLRLPVLDPATDTYFREAITKAGVAYATCRVVNASVSIVKESYLELEPAGIGVSLAVGQALDPIDDMTERLSDVLVTAITSLGVQKLSYEMSVSLAPPILAVFLLALSILIWFKNERATRLKKGAMGVLLIIVVARFCLPMSSVANTFLQKHFFADQISEATSELSLVSARLDKIKDFSLPEIDGVLKTIENSASFLKQKSMEFKDAIGITASHMGDIIENLLQLTFLYVGVFLIQVIILPLLTFWLLVKTINFFLATHIPVILSPSQRSGNKIIRQSPSAEG
jgi:hypothetical protein